VPGKLSGTVKQKAKEDGGDGVRQSFAVS